MNALTDHFLWLISLSACVSLGAENFLVEEGDKEATLLVSLPHVFDKSITVGKFVLYVLIF